MFCVFVTQKVGDNTFTGWLDKGCCLEELNHAAEFDLEQIVAILPTLQDGDYCKLISIEIHVAKAKDEDIDSHVQTEHCSICGGQLSFGYCLTCDAP